MAFTRDEAKQILQDLEDELISQGLNEDQVEEGLSEWIANNLIEDGTWSEDDEEVERMLDYILPDGSHRV
ncbi:MAG: hypothetical protein LC687_00710 [Actinobacteria bacterium]|nr:hypothetical protein [Actinomycetota bacterium]